MTDAQALERGRGLFARKAWADSYRLLHAANRDAPLEPEDLEQLAIAAYLVGRDDDCEAFTARAHQSFPQSRRPRRGRSGGIWLGFALLGRGARAPASGWLAKAERVLNEGQLDCVVRGYLLIPAAIQRVVQGDPSAAHAIFSQAAEIARRLLIGTWRRWPATDVGGRSSASETFPKVSPCSMKRWPRSLQAT